MADDHAGDLVGPYVLEACSPDEMRLVDEHAGHCPECAAEIAELREVTEWVGATAAREPAPALRSRVISAALAARPATTRVAEVRRLGELYRVQVEDLDRLLSDLPERQWQLPSGPHGSVRALVAHLHGNDAAVAAVAGAPPVPADATADVRVTWRRRADAILEVVDQRGDDLLDRQVPLAGRAVLRRPLREALIQRGFETWIHAEDVRNLLRLPSRRPSGRQLSDIVDFASRLLPGAMAAAGRAHPDKAIRLVLSGEGGGSRSVGLSPASPAATTVVAEIAMPADRFCLLLAGRLAGPPPDAEIGGDRSVAADFLTVAATLGCD